MKSFTGAALLVLFHMVLLFPGSAHAETPQTGRPADDSIAQTVEWSSRAARHVYGLPDAKANQKGTLTLSANELRFNGKGGEVAIARQSITAVSAGNQRVEIWGMKGRVLRAVIPDGGGVAAAMFMHHQVDMLTVEFVDARGGYHGAVFFLPANEAAKALDIFARVPMVVRELPVSGCQDGFVRPHSLLLAAPVWDQVEVPAAYRALVYERLLDRLRLVKGLDRVYRDGEGHSGQGCPEYTLRLSISGFKEGSQVKRAVLGPAGFFLSTTQMKFDATVTDASGAVRLQQQIKATTRGETESTSVATDVAKKLAKQYDGMLRKAPESKTVVAGATAFR